MVEYFYRKKSIFKEVSLMYLIIQKICEKNNKILKEGVKKVLNGEDISSLTGAIK